MRERSSAGQIDDNVPVHYRTRGGVESLARGLCWQVLRTLRIPPIVTVNGLRMELDARNGGISRTLFVYGEREIDHTSLLNRYVSPGMRCLDLGANIGYYTLLLADLVGSSGAVFAIEPDSRNIPLLRANIQRNRFASRVVVREIAVADRDGTAHLNIGGPTNLTSLQARSAQSADLDKTEVRDIGTMTLGSLGHEIGPVELIRMDVEGAEALILGSGGLKYLASLSPNTTLFFEVHPDHYARDYPQFSAVLADLSSIGFAPHLLVSSGEQPSRKFMEMGLTPEEKYVEGPFTRVAFAGATVDQAIQLIIERPKVVRYAIWRKAN